MGFPGGSDLQEMTLSLALLLCWIAAPQPDAPPAEPNPAPYQASALPRAAAATDTIPIALVLADRLYSGWARASIVRPRGDGPDIIVVTRETTPADLAKAVGMLLESRESAEPPLDYEIRAHVSASEEAPEPSEMVDVLADGLERLPQAPAANVPDYGMVPRLVIEVPVEPAAVGEDIGLSPVPDVQDRVASLQYDRAMPSGARSTTGMPTGDV